MSCNAVAVEMKRQQSISTYLALIYHFKTLGKRWQASSTSVSISPPKAGLPAGRDVRRYGSIRLGD